MDEARLIRVVVLQMPLMFAGDIVGMKSDNALSGEGSLDSMASQDRF